MLVSFKALAVVVMCGTGRQCLEPIPNKRIPKELGHEPWCVPKTQWACTACASGVKGVVGEPGPPKRIGGFRRPHQAEHVPKSTRRVHLPVDVTPKMEDSVSSAPGMQLHDSPSGMGNVDLLSRIVLRQEATSLSVEVSPI